MTEPMSDERLAELRALANHAPHGLKLTPHEARALLDEVDRLRAWKAEAIAVLAEWEETWQALGRPGLVGASKASGVLGEVVRLRAEVATSEDARGSALRSMDRWREQARNASARADRAEAALARVTDDSMAEAIRRAILDAPGSRGLVDNRPAAVLEVIRAVAAGAEAGEQTEEDE